MAAAPLAGKLIALQGQVAVAKGGGQDWQPAQVNQDLMVQDAIRTGPDSRAAILCVDESQLKVNENTVLVLRAVLPSPRLGIPAVVPASGDAAKSLYQVPQGEVWLRNTKERHPLEVETPAVTAAIRGTEFNLRVRPDGASYIALLGGSLALSNPQGQMLLAPGEEGVILPGQAPSKRVLVQPADAVQWSLYYPGIFSFRDLPLADMASAGPPALIEAVAAYDRGDVAAAQKAAETALGQAPDNDAALTLLGWISLQQQAPAEGQGYFSRAVRPRPQTLVGLALARYRQGDAAGAHQLMEQHAAQGQVWPQFMAMRAFFALMAGKAKEARGSLEAHLTRQPGDALARSLLAQIYLAQNNKARAQAEAAQAAAQAPGSPLAQLTLALAHLANFEAAAAATHLQQALTLDPRFIPAYVYLAKLQMGGDYLKRAWQTVQRGLQLAPDDAELLTLAGFVRLGFRDYARAREYFQWAVAANPALGEPHLGLGIYHFRYRQPDQGLMEMLTATLLEPRISLYQSELGKALYQVRAFDKALAAYDYAKTLDPRDPTPHLYKGIALTDLNRPAEAVQEFDRSLVLNDNRAMFRTRLSLDRDQAVQNYNVAKAYSQLGLGDWAYSKAVTAVKQDPQNSSAYLFLAESYRATRQLVGAGTSSLLLYRLLSPANQNTFSQFNDYTPMYEMPYGRVIVEGGVGAWRERRPLQGHSLEAYGGVPGLALDVAGFYNDDRGFRKVNSDRQGWSVLGLAKWEPTVNTSIMAGYSYLDVEQGDTGELSDINYRNSPYLRQYSRWRNYEAGLVQRFSPQSTLLVYYTYAARDERANNFSFGAGNSPLTLSPVEIIPAIWYQTDSGLLNYTFRDYNQRLAPVEFHNLQVQKQLTLGDHTFMAGFDYFTGHLKYRSRDAIPLNYNSYDNLTSAWTFPLFPWLDNTFTNAYTAPLNVNESLSLERNYRPPNRNYTFYLLDYWRLHPKVLVELGIFKDLAKNARPGFADPIYNSSWNPRFGLNLFLTQEHTLRLAAQQSLNTHYLSAASLAPPDVAGFPWQINVDEGGQVRELGLAWEAQWTPKTFSVLRLQGQRLAAPLYEVDGDGNPVRSCWTWRRYVASFTAQRIIGKYWGFSLGGLAKKIDPSFSLGNDFAEYQGFTHLVFWHPSGFRAGVRGIGLRQDLSGGRGDNFFGLVDAALGYEFPGKLGVATLEVTNLLNRQFSYQREFVALDSIYPMRRIMFKLALWL